MLNLPQQIAITNENGSLQFWGLLEILVLTGCTNFDDAATRSCLVAVIPGVLLRLKCNGLMGCVFCEKAMFKQFSWFEMMTSY